MMSQENREQINHGQEAPFAGVVIAGSLPTPDADKKEAGSGQAIKGASPAQDFQASDEHIQYMVDHSSDVFWQMDQDLNITFINAACETISGGMKREDFIGKSLLEFLTPEGIEQLRQINGRRLKDESQGIKTDIVFYELQMRRKDGSYFWSGISSSPRRDQNGAVTGYQGMMRDISGFKQHEAERKRLEDLLTRTEKMAAVGNMAGGVAHELNNVMACILGYSELLMFQNNLENDDFRRHVRNIIYSGERAAAMIQDLLIVSRKESTGRKRVNLNDLLSACLNKYEFQKLSERCPGITLHMDMEPSLRDVNASVPPLEKTIMNLLALSFEQAGPKGAVSVATRTIYLGRPINGYDNLREGEYVVLSVTDAGDGMADEDIVNVFEPFYIKKIMKKGVTGLELSVAREVVKDHNGFIDVRSKIGSGSTFTIYLPVSRREMSGNHSRTRRSSHSGSPTAINRDDLF